MSREPGAESATLIDPRKCCQTSQLADLNPFFVFDCPLLRVLYVRSEVASSEMCMRACANDRLPCDVPVEHGIYFPPLQIFFPNVFKCKVNESSSVPIPLSYFSMSLTVMYVLLSSLYPICKNINTNTLHSIIQKQIRCYNKKNLFSFCMLFAAFLPFSLAATEFFLTFHIL